MVKPKKKKRATKYNTKLAIDANFGKVIEIAMKDTDIKPEKAKKKTK